MIAKTPALTATVTFLLLVTSAPLLAQQSTDPPKTSAKGSELSKSDQRYFVDLAEANLAEVQAGKVAQDKAVSEEVKAFAHHMVSDHGKMFDEQRSLARKKNTALPGSPDKHQQDAMKKLQGLSGQAFDRAYTAQMVKGHEATLKLVQEIAAKADDADLKAAAQKVMPDIQKHLEKARSLASAQAPAKVGSAK